EIDRALRLPRAHEDAALARAEREDVPRRHEVLGLALAARGETQGVSAIGGADAGGDAVARLDAHRERGAEARRGATRRGHHREAEASDRLLGEREADEAAA